ncbi:CinA family protein [Kocuria sp.]|uniref:CinA family protein n=1 Tax=Kocuria sp. TaxID=1871328 RepID=UPI0026E08C76|nr:CinA family protein [Kocuria sp.]MDO5618740.1 CinA family protein [Kocuria sp.]
MGSHEEAALEAARRAVAVAAQCHLTVGTAESLTGGSVAAALVSVPGASAVFEGAVVSYSHAVKTRVLGVSAELLDRVGAVDAQVAEDMARGAREVLGVDVAVATTGVAGPEPHDGKPVGTVYVGLAGLGGTRSLELHLDGTRPQIRQACVEVALTELAVHCQLSESSQ